LEKHRAENNNNLKSITENMKKNDLQMFIPLQVDIIRNVFQIKYKHINLRRVKLKGRHGIKKIRGPLNRPLMHTRNHITLH
jgi:hypothetical protein